MSLQFLEQIVLKYLEAHPEIVEKLVSDLLGKLIQSIETKLHSPNPNTPTA